MSAAGNATAAVSAAIEALRSLSAAEYEQHLADGDVLVTEMSAEQRKRWGARMKALQPIDDVWTGAHGVDDCDEWHRVVLSVLRDRDAAGAVLSEVSALLRDREAEAEKLNQRVIDLTAALAKEEADARVLRELEAFAVRLREVAELPLYSKSDAAQQDRDAATLLEAQIRNTRENIAKGAPHVSGR